MGVKVYKCPDEVPAPEPDFMNYDHTKAQAAEEAHQKALKAHYEAMGYTGKHTGKIYSEGVADGAAQYMIFEAPRGSKLREKFFLIHLPYGDAYQSRTVQYMNKTGIIKLVESAERFAAILGKGDK